MENTGDLLASVNVGRPEIKHFQTRKAPEGAEWTGLSESRDSSDVYFNTHALTSALEDMKRKGSFNEAAGFLIGRRFIDEKTGRSGSEVVRYLPIPDGLVIPSRASITFTPDAMKYGSVEAEKLGDPSLEFLGWIHTHPGYGIFLSRDDDIVTAQFSIPGQIAVVYDPTEGSQGIMGVFSTEGAAEPREIGGRRTEYGNGYRLHRGVFVTNNETTGIDNKDVEKLIKVGDEATTSREQLEQLVKIEEPNVEDLIQVGTPYESMDWKQFYPGGIKRYIERGKDILKQLVKDHTTQTERAISRREAIQNWVRWATPIIEEALLENRHKANNPIGDLYSMNLCSEAGQAIPAEELKVAGIEGNKMFGVEANNHTAVHVGYYHPESELIIDPTSGQWMDPEGRELTKLIEQHPDLFVGRILVATSEKIKKELGWDYKVY